MIFQTQNNKLKNNNKYNLVLKKIIKPKTKNLTIKFKKLKKLKKIKNQLKIIKK